MSIYNLTGPVWLDPSSVLRAIQATPPAEVVSFAGASLGAMEAAGLEPQTIHRATTLVQDLRGALERGETGVPQREKWARLMHGKVLTQPPWAEMLAREKWVDGLSRNRLFQQALRGYAYGEAAQIRGRIGEWVAAVEKQRVEADFSVAPNNRGADSQIDRQFDFLFALLDRTEKGKLLPNPADLPETMEHPLDPAGNTLLQGVRNSIWEADVLAIIRTGILLHYFPSYHHQQKSRAFYPEDPADYYSLLRKGEIQKKADKGGPVVVGPIIEDIRMPMGVLGKRDYSLYQKFLEDPQKIIRQHVADEEIRSLFLRLLESRGKDRNLFQFLAKIGPENWDLRTALYLLRGCPAEVYLYWAYRRDCLERPPGEVLHSWETFQSALRESQPFVIHLGNRFEILLAHHLVEELLGIDAANGYLNLMGRLMVYAPKSYTFDFGYLRERSFSASNDFPEAGKMWSAFLHKVGEVVTGWSFKELMQAWEGVVAMEKEFGKGLKLAGWCGNPEKAAVFPALCERAQIHGYFIPEVLDMCFADPSPLRYGEGIEKYLERMRGSRVPYKRHSSESPHAIYLVARREFQSRVPGRRHFPNAIDFWRVLSVGFACGDLSSMEDVFNGDSLFHRRLRQPTGADRTVYEILLELREKVEKSRRIFKARGVRSLLQRAGQAILSPGHEQATAVFVGLLPRIDRFDQAVAAVELLAVGLEDAEISESLIFLSNPRKAGAKFVQYFTRFRGEDEIPLPILSWFPSKEFRWALYAVMRRQFADKFPGEAFASQRVFNDCLDMEIRFRTIEGFKTLAAGPFFERLVLQAKRVKTRWEVIAKKVEGDLKQWGEGYLMNLTRNVKELQRLIGEWDFKATASFDASLAGYGRALKEAVKTPIPYDEETMGRIQNHVFLEYLEREKKPIEDFLPYGILRFLWDSGWKDRMAIFMRGAKLVFNNVFEVNRSFRGNLEAASTREEVDAAFKLAAGGIPLEGDDFKAYAGHPERKALSYRVPARKTEIVEGRPYDTTHPLDVMAIHHLFKETHLDFRETMEILRGIESFGVPAANPEIRLRPFTVRVTRQRRFLQREVTKSVLKEFLETVRRVSKIGEPFAHLETSGRSKKETRDLLIALAWQREDFPEDKRHLLLEFPPVDKATAEEIRAGLETLGELYRLADKERETRFAKLKILEEDLIRLKKELDKIETNDLGPVEILLRPSRDPLDGLAPTLVPNCLEEDDRFLSNMLLEPDYMPFRVIVEGEWKGMIQTYAKKVRIKGEEGEKKILILTGLDPSKDMVIHPGQFIRQVLDHFRRMAKEGGYDYVVLPVVEGMQTSNRGIYGEEIDRHLGPVIQLEEPVGFPRRLTGENPGAFYKSRKQKEFYVVG